MASQTKRIEKHGKQNQGVKMDEQALNEMRERNRLGDKIWYSNPINHEKHNEANRKWRADPVNREKHNEASRKWYANPVNHEKQNARHRERRARQKELKNTENKSEN